MKVMNLIRELFNDTPNIFVKKQIIDVEDEFLQLFNFYENEIKVGEILIGINNGGCKHQIHYIFSEKRGYGRIMIEYIRNLEEVNVLFGYSLDETIGFWKRMGACFITNQNFEIRGEN